MIGTAAEISLSTLGSSTMNETTAEMTVAVARGKKLFDKRAAAAERDAKRQDENQKDSAYNGVFHTLFLSLFRILSLQWTGRESACTAYEADKK